MIKIYKLIHNGEIVYVGQTKLSFSRRRHKGYGKTVPFYKECSMELIEETSDTSRERYWIDKLRSEGHPLLNKHRGVSGLDKKEWQKGWEESNKEKRSQYQKKWRDKNKEENRIKQREYRKRKKLKTNNE
jgi:hypothetical protein